VRCVNSRQLPVRSRLPLLPSRKPSSWVLPGEVLFAVAGWRPPPTCRGFFRALHPRTLPPSQPPPTSRRTDPKAPRAAQNRAALARDTEAPDARQNGVEAPRRPHHPAIPQPPTYRAPGDPATPCWSHTQGGCCKATSSEVKSLRSCGVPARRQLRAPSRDRYVSDCGDVRSGSDGCNQLLCRTQPPRLPMARSCRYHPDDWHDQET
jgi:hypothetical protein